MKIQEYTTMNNLEEKHWWYLGLRSLLGQLILKYLPENSKHILDAGCGTGENLKYLSQLLPHIQLEGFDISTEALKYASKKTSAQTYIGDICNPPMTKKFDLIYSCDVIYVPGLKKSLPGLEKLTNSLNPGGILILHLPALPWLYSQHDVAIHTSQRFYTSHLKNLCLDLNLQPIVLSYRVFFLFPLILLSRIPTMIKQPSLESAVSDLKIPNLVINKILFIILKVENFLLKYNFKFPIGSSVILVAKKH